MGESVRHGVDMDEGALFFVANCGGAEQKYGPYTDINDFFWNAGFVTGYLAAKGYRPKDIKIRTYQNDTLIDEQ